MMICSIPETDLNGSTFLLVQDYSRGATIGSNFVARLSAECLVCYLKLEARGYDKLAASGSVQTGSSVTGRGLYLLELIPAGLGGHVGSIVADA